jgi:hypothetical protein
MSNIKGMAFFWRSGEISFHGVHFTGNSPMPNYRLCKPVLLKTTGLFEFGAPSVETMQRHETMFRLVKMQFPQWGIGINHPLVEVYVEE